MAEQRDSIAGEVITRFLLLLLGLMLLLPAVNKFYTYCHFHLFGVYVHGTVTHSSSGRDLGGRPLVEYEDEQGLLHEFKSRAKTHWFKRPAKGESIALFFDKEEPQKAIVNNFYYYVFLPMLFIAAGSYCCLKSIWFPRSARRKNESC